MAVSHNLKREFAKIEVLRERVHEAQLDIDKAQNRFRQCVGDLQRGLESLKREVEQASEYSTTMYIPPDLAREIRRIAGKVPFEEREDDD